MRAPALPVTASVVLSVLGLVVVLALIWRVLIDPPGSPLDERYGAYVSLVAAVAMLYGDFLSLREEGLADADARTDIETVRLRSARTGDAAGS
jgi:hypothetical protein